MTEDQPVETTPEEETQDPQEMDTQEDGVDFKNKGNEEYKKGRYKEALDLYTQAIERESDNAAFYGNRSAAYMMLRKYPECIRDCQKALELDPSFVKAFSRLGKAYFCTGECDKAIAAYRSALKCEINPSLEKDLQVAQHCERTLRQCKQHVEKEEWMLAAHKTRALLREAPDATPFVLLHCETLINTNKADEAAQQLINLRYDQPCNPDVLYLRGKALFYSNQNNLNSAAQHMRQALEFDRESDRAKTLLKQIRQFENLKQEGNKHFQGKNWEEAIEAYTQALAVDPNNKRLNAVLYCNRAAANKEAGKSQEAIDDCSTAIDMDDTYTKAYVRRGRCYQSIEEHEKAVRDFEKAYTLDPSNKPELREAKEQLKRSKRKDYYKILGIDKDSDERQIKKAFREAALKYHPDKLANASEEDKAKGEVKFKEMQEAVEVLTDPTKRRRYDNGMDIDGNGMGMGGMDPSDMSSVFNMFFTGGGGGGAPTFTRSGRRGGGGTTFTFKM